MRGCEDVHYFEKVNDIFSEEISLPGEIFRDVCNTRREEALPKKGDRYTQWKLPL